jgi:hypothetical protein
MSNPAGCVAHAMLAHVCMVCVGLECGMCNTAATYGMKLVALSR